MCVSVTVGVHNVCVSVTVGVHNVCVNVTVGVHNMCIAVKFQCYKSLRHKIVRYLDRWQTRLVTFMLLNILRTRPGCRHYEMRVAMYISLSFQTKNFPCLLPAELYTFVDVILTYRGKYKYSSYINFVTTYFFSRNTWISTHPNNLSVPLKWLRSTVNTVQLVMSLLYCYFPATSPVNYVDTRSRHSSLRKR
jgi:hypothetical protein